MGTLSSHSGMEMQGGARLTPGITLPRAVASIHSFTAVTRVTSASKKMVRYIENKVPNSPPAFPCFHSD